MTPQREKYFAKIGKKEKVLREKIKTMKYALKISKMIISRNIEVLGMPLKEANVISGIYENKVKLNAYRRALARLKGMDRVVRVKNTYLDCYGSDCFECKCGHEVEVGYYEHCPWCGRKILLEKVINNA